MNNVKVLYPNLMCFGNEPHKCDHQNFCKDYEACKEMYREIWFSFMDGGLVMDSVLNITEQERELIVEALQHYSSYSRDLYRRFHGTDEEAAHEWWNKWFISGELANKLYVESD